jgi:hypothetical protein
MVAATLKPAGYIGQSVESSERGGLGLRVTA